MSDKIITNATLDDLKKMWDESMDIGEFYEKLKSPPFIVTNEVLNEFEGFIKDHGIDIYQSFLDGVQNISKMNEKEFDNQWENFAKNNKVEKIEERKLN